MPFIHKLGPNQDALNQDVVGRRDALNQDQIVNMNRGRNRVKHSRPTF